ncbi:hypothetical protein THAOC_11627, partial [Thalassiosira oceanica]
EAIIRIRAGRDHRRHRRDAATTRQDEVQAEGAPTWASRRRSGPAGTGGGAGAPRLPAAAGGRPAAVCSDPASPPSDPVIRRVRHGDPRVRHAALIALSGTVYGPSLSSSSPSAEGGNGKASDPSLLRAVSERLLDADVPTAIAAAGCLANYAASGVGAGDGGLEGGGSRGGDGRGGRGDGSDTPAAGDEEPIEPRGDDGAEDRVREVVAQDARAVDPPVPVSAYPRGPRRELPPGPREDGDGGPAGPAGRAPPRGGDGGDSSGPQRRARGTAVTAVSTRVRADDAASHASRALHSLLDENPPPRLVDARLRPGRRRGEQGAVAVVRVGRTGVGRVRPRRGRRVPPPRVGCAAGPAEVRRARLRGVGGGAF